MKKTKPKLSSAPINKKIYFTFFLLMMASAFVIGMLNYCDKTKFSYDRTVRYYRGDEDSFVPSLPSDEMVDEDFNPSQTGMFFKKTYQELLNITHTHCFSIAIVLFILSRILEWTSIKEWMKIAICSLAFTGLAANLGAPWLITFVTPYAVIVLTLSNIALCFSFAAYIIIPLYEIWFGKKPALCETEYEDS